MKKIDRLLITSFLPPFLVSMMIAMFVLLMQTLWLYIDDIAGKGLGFFLVVELLAYKCVALVPLALPIAILISSVMVIGNLAEFYELSSFKSAGVSLLRIMRPLIAVGFLSALFSYYCGNYLMPAANLKFGSRMYDIQRHKPTLRLDAGVFNYDFQGYAIHIGRKERDGKSIRHVLIYDHSDDNTNEFTQIVAAKGEMYPSPDGKFFIMNLRDGHQYTETRSAYSGGSQAPFVRVAFEEWTKVFDLSQFDLSRTDEELFKSNRSMLTISQLGEAIDSISLKIEQRKKNFSNAYANYLSFLKPDSTFIERPKITPFDTATTGRALDSLSPDSIPALPRVSPLDQDAAAPAVGNGQDDSLSRTRRIGPVSQVSYSGPQPLLQEPELEGIQSIIKTFPLYEQRQLYSRAATVARTIQNQAEAAQRFLYDLRESRVKHIYDMHTKYSMAIVCIIFIFIGAPMGAIVRKGGFGYPILVSIFFFMLFVILTIFCRKIAESFVVPAEAAAWIPLGILTPLGALLTHKAMHDAAFINMDGIVAFFSRLAAKLFPQKTA
jgi:lipopolysaccharide export system permease protein